MSRPIAQSRVGCEALLAAVGGAGELHGRRLEALDRTEDDSLLVRAIGVVLGVDDDDLAGAELLVEDALGERVFDLPLDRTTQRPGAEGRVIAALREEDLRGLRELEAEALALELRGDPLDHQVDDLRDLARA